MERVTLNRMLSDERGFGLPTAILLVAVLVPLGIFGLALARQEQRTNLRTGSRAIAFYAAETGVARALDNWNTLDVAETGESWVVHEGVLEGGATYRVEATKLDDANNVHGLFAIRSEGRAPDGRVQRSALMVATVPLGSPIRGALRTTDQVRIAGQAEVNGFDSIPATWEDDCPPMLTDEAGVIMADTTRMTRSGASSVYGAPAIEENSDTTGIFNFGELTYEEVAAQADFDLPHGTNISGTEPAPAYTADGKCDTNDSGNWGDPENDSQPCSDWFPIIHGLGDLTLSGSGAGQGILLVDGDLSLCGGATFYGPVVVKGMVKSCGSGFRLYGGVVAGESDLSPQGGGMVIGASRVQYGSCVVQRAISRSGAGVPRPLAERAWFQLR